MQRIGVLLPKPWVELGDLGNAVTWLSSHQARAITGVVLPVDLGIANQPSGIPPIGAQDILGTARQSDRNF
jgi:hypothetical protein